MAGVQGSETAEIHDDERRNRDPSPPVAALVADYSRVASPSARVLLTTVFGDALLPRDASIGVQDLAGLVAPLAVNERSVRTALQRLATEGVVVGDRQGRRSFYRVHPSAEATFRAADERIYARRTVAWDGLWTVAVVGSDSGGRARRLIEELRWLGMAELRPGVAVSATIDAASVVRAAGRTGGELLALTRGPLQAGSLSGEELRRSMVDPTGDLHRLYQQHLVTFTPWLDAASDLTPMDAFVVRTVLIDSWRRLALRTIEVPLELEPSEWPGAEAFALTAQLHGRVRAASEAHLDGFVGSSPRAIERFHNR